MIDPGSIVIMLVLLIILLPASYFLGRAIKGREVNAVEFKLMQENAMLKAKNKTLLDYYKEKKQALLQDSESAKEIVDLWNQLNKDLDAAIVDTIEYLKTKRSDWRYNDGVTELEYRLTVLRSTLARQNFEENVHQFYKLYTESRKAGMSSDLVA